MTFFNPFFLILVLLLAVAVLALVVARRIKRHRRGVSQQLSLEGFRPSQGWRHHVLVLASDIHRGTIPALQYARALSSDARGVYVLAEDGDAARKDEERLRSRWTKWSRGVPLVVLPMCGRSIADPIVAYIERIQRQEPDAMVTIIMPELVTSGRLVSLLHGKSSRELKQRLRKQRGVIVTSIPFHVAAYVAPSKQNSKPKNVAAKSETAVAR